MMMIHRDDNGQTFLDRLINSSSAVATVVVALVGQALFTFVWQVRHNEQMDAAIAALRVENAHQTMRIESHERSVQQQLDQLDRSGSRQLQVVIDRQGTNTSTIAEMLKRLNEMDRRLTEFIAITSHPAPR